MHHATTKHQIKPENIWNVDEKGFLIGIGQTAKCIITVEASNKLQGVRNRQDGNREFVT